MSKLLLSGLLLALFVAACSSGAATADQTAALEARIVTLEGRIAELEAAAAAAPTPEADDHASDQAFEVVIAQYVMANAGFHLMDETLNETRVVDPAYAGAVDQVRKVITRTPWPEEFQGQVDAFHEILEEFSAALEADDAEAAATLAAEAHTAQHDLSAALDEWMGEGGDHAD